jgi:hypothetical protein
MTPLRAKAARFHQPNKVPMPSTVFTNSLAITCLATWLLPPCVAYAQSGVGQVAAEATVFESAPDRNSGGYDNICVGNHDGLVTTRRAFARFTLPSIPQGSTVTRVVYNFTQVQVRQMGVGSPKTANLELRRVEADWVEGTGLFLSSSCGGGDTVPGINWANAPPVQAAASADVFLPSTINTPIIIDTDIGNADDGLIVDAQAWVDNPATNFGWEYRLAEESVLDNARRLLPGSVTVHWTVPPLNFADGFESAP